ncbi:MAG TPA: ABC transporter ATP-binding protein [Solirubrobacterales bacterium]|nr:ABC transporter ATP-binding protein [Solirubrobacterales bacterium]
MTAGPLLDISDLHVSFPVGRKRLIALDGVSLQLRPHETLGVVGESGSGKSTLAKTIVRLVKADQGVVSFAGEDVLGLTGRRLAQVRRQIQLVYQDPYASLNPSLPAWKAIAEPALVHGLAERSGARALAGALLEKVGLSGSVATRRPARLSGGQRQRVAIARALAVEPTVLIADEAVSALDVSVQAQMLNLFRDLQVELGLSMLFISHQLGVVRHVADRVAVLYLGRVVEIGPTSQVFSEPAHPYTAGLLRAQPSRRRRAGDSEPVLKGEIPSPLAIPGGCRFRTRCPLATSVCAEVDPPRVDLDRGHSAWCHHVHTQGT